MTTADLYRYLSGYRYGVLGTVGSESTPQSALVGIAITDALEIVFDTVRQSRKFANLKARPQCSFAIGWDWQRTAQYEGEAEELAGTALKRCQTVYFAQFPDGPERLSWPGITYFVVRPRWIRYSDFGPERLIQEFRF